MIYQEITVTNHDQIEYQGIYYFSPAQEGPEEYSFAEWKQIYGKILGEKNWFKTTEAPPYTIEVYDMGIQETPEDPRSLEEHFQARHKARPGPKDIKTSTRQITEEELHMIAFSAKPQEDL